MNEPRKLDITFGVHFFVSYPDEKCFSITIYRDAKLLLSSRICKLLNVQKVGDAHGWDLFPISLFPILRICNSLNESVFLRTYCNPQDPTDI